MQFCFSVLKYLNVLVVRTCLHMLHLVPSGDLQQLFFFLREATLAVTSMSFMLLAHPNLIIGTFPKTFPGYIPGVNSNSISDGAVLSFENTGRYVVLKTNLLSFLLRFSLFKTFNCKN